MSGRRGYSWTEEAADEADKQHEELDQAHGHPRRYCGSLVVLPTDPPQTWVCLSPPDHRKDFHSQADCLWSTAVAEASLEGRVRLEPVEMPSRPGSAFGPPPSASFYIVVTEEPVA